MSPLAPDGLRGVRVGLFEARKATEMADLIRRHGAIVRSAPAVSEAAIDSRETVARFLDQLSTPSRRIYVFLTGVGAATLLEEADRQGRLRVLVESMKNSIVVSRGPKPAAALRRYGMVATLTVPSPYTSYELLGVLGAQDLAGTELTLVHYGERNNAVSDALRSRGARLIDLCLYEWRLPSDLKPLRDMVSAVVTRGVEAVVFTSQVQWKHLMRVAADASLVAPMIAALNSDIVVAAIGPVCASALAESGVHPRVVPANPKMGPLVTALVNYFSQMTQRR